MEEFARIEFRVESSQLTACPVLPAPSLPTTQVHKLSQKAVGPARFPTTLAGTPGWGRAAYFAKSGIYLPTSPPSSPHKPTAASQPRFPQDSLVVYKLVACVANR